MNTQFNKRMALLAFNSGLIISTLMANDVLAAECGQARLVEAGSAGVKITKNTCQDPTRVTAGSVLELSAGSRMWLKFNPSAKGEAVQVICQNRSADTVKVQVANASEPWIKPENVKSCESWKNNKLTCEGSSGEKSFFCAVAKAKSETMLASASGKSKKLSEVTTSVKMRGIQPIAVPVTPEDVVKSLKPDIELCKSLFNVSEKVDMSWTVSLGKIQDLSVTSENKDLVSCVEDVVKQANADQDISIKYSF